MKSLFDSVGANAGGRKRTKDGTMKSKVPRVVRAVLEDKTVIVGLDLLRREADDFLSKLKT